MGQQASDRFFTADICALHPDATAAIGDELRRQQDEIKLIASENIVPRAVLQAKAFPIYPLLQPAAKS